MSAALIVRRRAKPPPRRCFRRDPFEKAVERQIEIQPRLLAVSDHIQPRRKLIVDRRDDRVVLHLGNVIGAELIQIPAGKFQPSRQRIAADDGCA